MIRATRGILKLGQWLSSKNNQTKFECLSFPQRISSASGGSGHYDIRKFRQSCARLRCFDAARLAMDEFFGTQIINYNEELIEGFSVPKVSLSFSTPNTIASKAEAIRLKRRWSEHGEILRLLSSHSNSMSSN